MILTEEDNDALSQIRTDLISYTEEMRATWLSKGGVEEGWDAYIQQLKELGLDTFMEIYQRNYTATHSN